MLTQYTQTRNISANKKLTYCRKEITSRHFAINDWEFACRCQPEFGIGQVSMYELRAHKRKITNCNTASIFCIYILLLHMLLLENKTHPFNGPLSGTTRVSQHQKGKPIWILLKQETVSGSGISWAICKPAPRSRQLTTPAPHHSVFYRPDALPTAQPTASKHLLTYLLTN